MLKPTLGTINRATWLEAVLFTLNLRPIAVPRCLPTSAALISGICQQQMPIELVKRLTILFRCECTNYCERAVDIALLLQLLSTVKTVIGCIAMLLVPIQI